MSRALGVIVVTLLVAGCSGSTTLPSGQMEPTIPAGEKVKVDFAAYLFNGPVRGDIVLYQVDEVRTLSRVVAVAGDEVQMIAGRLHLNGELVPLEAAGEGRVTGGGPDPTWRAALFRETLPGEASGHLIADLGQNTDYDDTPLFVVPEGKVFLMGDNRDNSLDSRASGGHPERDLAEWPNSSRRDMRWHGYVSVDAVLARVAQPD